jgi:uncharacterized repeat protein (TIGR01451 family)
VRNIATVDAWETDPHPADNSDEATIGVAPDAPRQRIADLRATKHASHARVATGEPLTYLLRVTNHGPDPATAVRLADASSSTRRVLSVHPSQGSCHGATVLTCDLGRVEPGHHATVEVVAEITRGGIERNTATVSAAELDPEPANNLASATVKALAVLRLDKTASPLRIVAGQTVSFAIRVGNPTAAPIDAVTVCDAMPTGLAFLHATAPASRHGRDRCWTISSLPAGTSRTITLTARALRGAAGTLRNTAVATAPGARPAHATANVEVAPAAPPGSVTGLG